MAICQTETSCKVRHPSTRYSTLYRLSFTQRVYAVTLPDKHPSRARDKK